MLGHQFLLLFNGRDLKCPRDLLVKLHALAALPKVGTKSLFLDASSAPLPAACSWIENN